MAEASGIIFIRTPKKEHMKALLASKNSISGELICEILSNAGMQKSWWESEELMHEGVSKYRKFIKMSVFGDEWMHVLQSLVRQGKNIELYGYISHEYGLTEYYALNNEGINYCGRVDVEGGGDADGNALTEKWLSYIPTNIQNQFSNSVVPVGNVGLRNQIFSSFDKLISLIKAEKYDDLVGVWDATGAHPGCPSDETYVVIRPDKTHLYYFKEPGSGCFQYEESVLVSQGRNRYHQINKGGVLQGAMEDRCGMECVRYFREKTMLVSQDMDEQFQDVQYGYEYKRADIQESDIQPICSVQYESCD